MAKHRRFWAIPRFTASPFGEGRWYEQHQAIERYLPANQHKAKGGGSTKDEGFHSMLICSPRCIPGAFLNTGQPALPRLQADGPEPSACIRSTPRSLGKGRARRYSSPFIKLSIMSTYGCGSKNRNSKMGGPIGKWKHRNSQHLR